MFRSRIPAIVIALTGVIATAALLPLHVSDAADPSAPLLDISKLRPGDKGYGLTVFSGTNPERFDVEVIGVLNNFLPHQDLVLVKTFHPRLQVAKVVAGMSGSPVFIGGKMIGAYAYGWQFGEESVAGVTPIKSMLDELKRTVPKEYVQPLPGAAKKAATNRANATNSLADSGFFGSFGHRFIGNVASYSPAEHVRQVAARNAYFAGDGGSAVRAVPITTPISVGGLTSTSLAMLSQQLAPLGLEPLQAGGSAKATSSTPSRYVDGGAIGVQLISGDISAAGIGTVTRVQGNKVLAFGHPMTGGGVSRLPTAIATIHWIMASKARSFKIGAPIRTLGSLINDRQAAIVVDAHVEAPTIPVEVQLRGVDDAPHTRWTTWVAQERLLAPTFVSVAISNAIESTVSDRRDTSWHATTTLRVRKYGEITFHDTGVSANAASVAQDYLRSDAMRAFGALLNNPWEPVDIESVRARVDVNFSRDSLTLRGATALTPELEPGQKARIRLQLVPYAGPPQFRTVEVSIPRELAGSTVEIDLYPGASERRPAAAPESVADLIALLPNQSYRPDVLIAGVRVGGHGVAFRGKVATNLPAGALYALRAIGSTDGPEPVASYARTEIPLGKLVVGQTSVQVKVLQPR